MHYVKIILCATLHLTNAHDISHWRNDGVKCDIERNGTDQHVFEVETKKNQEKKPWKFWGGWVGRGFDQPRAVGVDQESLTLITKGRVALHLLHRQ
jgi:hypothetical protein